jgi:hypothetical protein
MRTLSAIFSPPEKPNRKYRSRNTSIPDFNE